MITLIFDPQGRQAATLDGSTFVAAELADYIPLRQFLHRALTDLTDQRYRAIVRHRLLYHWLDDLRDYGPQVVRYRSLSLRDRFTEQFDMACPEELTDEALHALNILALPRPYDATARQEPLGWLLGELVDPVWAARAPSDRHLADLAAWLAQSETLDPHLEPLLHSRLRAWQQADSRYRFVEGRSWQAAGQALLLRWALRTYPPAFLDTLELARVPLVPCERHQARLRALLTEHTLRTHLTHFWRQAPTQTLDEMLTTMSGLSESEVLAFQHATEVQPHALTPFLLAQAQALFRPLGDAARQRLRKLEEAIPPDLPTPPNRAWDVAQWLAWGTDEYLPYFTWVLRQHQPREQQMALAQPFGEWLVGAYPTLVLDPTAPLILHHLDAIRAAPHEAVLWLIVDGLTWWEGKRLSQEAETANLGVAFCQPSLAALPSITSISKRALVQGLLDESGASTPLRTLLQERLERLSVPAHLYTQPDPLRSKIQGSGTLSGIYVLFYNMLDSYHHSTTGFPDTAAVQGHLRELLDLVQRFMERGEREGLSVAAFVSSDHGATLLPATQAALAPPPDAEPLPDEGADDAPIGSPKGQSSRRRTRVYQTTRPVASLEPSLAADWWLLRGDLFNLPHSYLIPKAYAPVGGRLTGWTHGGPMPEEVITPFLCLQPRPVAVAELLPLGVRFDGQLQRGEASEVQVVLTNSNPVALTALNLHLPRHQVQERVPLLKGNETITLTFAVQPTATSSTYEEIPWQLMAQAAGQPFPSEGIAELPIRRLQSGNQMDELFEGL